MTKLMRSHEETARIVIANIKSSMPDEMWIHSTRCMHEIPLIASNFYVCWRFCTVAM